MQVCGMVLMEAVRMVCGALVPATAYIQAERVVVRAAARDAAPPVMELHIGATAELLETQADRWCKVRHKGTVGYVPCDDIGPDRPDKDSMLRQMADPSLDVEQRFVLAGRALAWSRTDDNVGQAYRKAFYALHMARLKKARTAGVTRPKKPVPMAWDVTPYVMQGVYQDDPRFSEAMWVGEGTYDAMVGVASRYGVVQVVLGKLIPINKDGDAGYVEEMVVPLPASRDVLRVLFTAVYPGDSNEIYPDRRKMGLGCREFLEQSDGPGVCAVGSQDEFVGCADVVANCSDACAQGCDACTSAAPQQCLQCQSTCGGKVACLRQCALEYEAAFARCSGLVRECVAACKPLFDSCVREHPLFEQEHCRVSCQPMLACRVEKCGNVKKDCVTCPKPVGCYCEAGR